MASSPISSTSKVLLRSIRPFTSLAHVTTAPIRCLAGQQQQRREFSFTAPSEAVKAKSTALKKKVAVRKKTSSGPRSTGGKRKGGADSSANLSRTTEFHQQSPDLSDLVEFNSENVTKDAVSHIMAWNKRALGAFKNFGLPRELAREQSTQSRPRTLVRPQTISLLDTLDASSNSKESTRSILVGEKGCGKSVLMTQGVSYALDEGWAVVYLPKAIDLINSSSPYVYSQTQLTYLQPSLTRALITSILEVNSSILKTLSTTEPTQLERSSKVEAGTPLDKLARLGLDETLNPAARHQVLEALVKGLASQTKVPVLFAIDDLQALFLPSLYRDPDYEILQSYELGLPRMLLSLLTPKDSPFALRRGAFLGALSGTHTEFPVPAELSASLNLALDSSKVHPYTPFNPTHLAHAQCGLKAIHVGQPLSKTEAAAIFAQLIRERAYWTATNDEFFLSKFVESAGNARTFQKSLLSSLI
ncbi:hypothetical protein IE53DRAFT_386118 [Violaceomyces palustris]|uniref:Uncharacterized protein n=1 Tax=Violaceomyces palustris TaxID=1673888 RepID=A0ACD0P086_9BASI|nr:hypothetical protein IE53DRAFT_386118 [Violaceomyces palustris]